MPRFSSGLECRDKTQFDACSGSPSMLFEMQAPPVFKMNAFGERILKQLAD
jgi:hypothetical protein